MISARAVAPHLDSEGNKVGTTVRPLRIGMLSIHSSPLGELGTEDTGGMSVYIRELCRALGRAGHYVDIYTCADSGMRGCELSLSDRVRLIHLGIEYTGDFTKSMLFGHLPDVFRSLEAYIADNPVCYDLIHSHYWLSSWVGGVAQKRWFVPHVVMFHTTGMAKRVACGREREPAFRLIAEKRLAHASDRVLAATEKERGFLMKYYRVPGEKIGVVPCGVDLTRFKPIPRGLARKELGLSDFQPIVLYVGRFAPIKGLDRLVAAAAHLRNHRGLLFLIVGGDGPQARTVSELTRLARRASVSDMVRFQGRVEHELLPLYYSAADALVVPSYYESFGLVALEALACGTPVVATPVGTMETLIEEGKTGLLARMPDPRCLARAIERCVTAASTCSISREEIRSSVLGYGWSNIASAVSREYALLFGPAG